MVNVNSYGDDRHGFPHWLVMAVVVVALVAGGVWWYQAQPEDLDLGAPWLRADMATEDDRLVAVAQSLRRLDPEGPYVSNVLVEPGVRRAAGELAGEGEVKVMFNLHWPSLPSEPSRREALDAAAAQTIARLFEDHEWLDKLRVIVKEPKARGEVGDSPGVARGHENAAKVFSFTRAAWDSLVARAPAQSGGAQATISIGDHYVEPRAILELGDYVVLEKGEWRRGW